MKSLEQHVDDIAFSTSSRIVIQFGRESISDSIVAIIELVKNSYDADAENVWIHFFNVDGSSENRVSNQLAPFLLIEDDGHGMTFDQIINKWMVIGIDDKAKNRVSNKKRIKVGEKGLGRLGLDRLSSHATLFTFVEEEDGGVKLNIDWTKYEDTSEHLDNVKHPVSIISDKSFSIPLSEPTIISKKENKGTVILLESLRDDWDSEYVDNLRQQLSLLVSPFRGENDFQIHLSIDGDSLPISSSEILDRAEWEVISELFQEDGEWYMLHSMTGRDHPDIEFNTTEKWSTIFPEADPNPNCGPIEFFFYFIPRVKISDEEIDFTRQEVSSFMDVNQGIRIYRDWFHVKPYGDPDGSVGDWLGLSYRRIQNPGARRSGNWRLGYNQSIGAILIERERNSNLTDQTNREGLVHGDAYDDLKRYANHVIEWFEENDYKAYLETKPSLTPTEEAEEKLQDSLVEADNSLTNYQQTVSGTLDKLEKDIQQGKTPNLDKVRNTLEKAAKKAKRKSKNNQRAQKEYVASVQEKTQTLEQRTDYLSNLASLGILSVAFGHETAERSNIVVQNTDLVYGDIEEILQSLGNQFQDEFKDISEQVELIQRYANQIHLFASFMLKNVIRDKRKRINTQLADLVREIFSIFNEDLVNERGIEIQLDWENDPPIIRAFAIDWESIFVNLITNSVHALFTIDREIRIIRVKLYSEDGFLYIKFADSGSGLEVSENWRDSDLDIFFQANKSTKRYKSGEVYGTGMGLFIVKQLLQRHYDGEISVTPVSDIGGAEFTIRIPITYLKED